MKMDFTNVSGVLVSDMGESFGNFSFESFMDATAPLLGEDLDSRENIVAVAHWNVTFLTLVVPDSMFLLTIALTRSAGYALAAFGTGLVLGFLLFRMFGTNMLFAHLGRAWLIGRFIIPALLIYGMLPVSTTLAIALGAFAIFELVFGVLSVVMRFPVILGYISMFIVRYPGAAKRGIAMPLPKPLETRVINQAICKGLAALSTCAPA